jgi:hypothetical protein
VAMTLVKPEQMSPTTLLSLSDLFLVSTLHSSQKTSESWLLGSEWVRKHLLHIECPHNRVRGIGYPEPGPHFRYSRQLRQESVPWMPSVWCLSVARLSRRSFLRLISLSAFLWWIFISSCSCPFNYFMLSRVSLKKRSLFDRLSTWEAWEANSFFSSTIKMCYCYQGSTFKFGDQFVGSLGRIKKAFVSLFLLLLGDGCVNEGLISWLDCFSLYRKVVY